jgi:hypothetical protein
MGRNDEIADATRYDRRARAMVKGKRGHAEGAAMGREG